MFIHYLMILLIHQKILYGCQRYIYTYAIQSKTDKVSDDMNNNLIGIINSAKYQKVKNSLAAECRIYRLSNIITVGVPILILLVILLVIARWVLGQAKS